MGGAPPEHPEWLQRLHRAREGLVPWIEETAPLAGRTVLEYGCGQGVSACAVAPRAARHIGVDIAAGEVAMARQHIARRGLANVELLAVPEGEVLDRVAAYQGAIDVFLLYAVLEHMTLDERLAACDWRVRPSARTGTSWCARPRTG